MELSEAVLIVALLLLVAVAAAGLGRRLPIPFTVLLVILGVLLGEGARNSETLAPLAHFELSPELVFFVFLPALIFESALNLDVRQLMRDIAPVMVLAVPALLLSTAIVGYGTAWITGLPLGVALLFGALISATDPVAVVALFKELGAPLRLTVLVEGESLFNDATAIVVFGILLGLVQAGTTPDAGLLFWAGWEFIRVFLGGVLVGGVIGLVIGELGARLRSNVPALIVLSLVMAYGAFVVGEHLLHVSGVMAAMTAALVLSGVGLARMPLETGPALRESWEVLGLIGNALLFLLVGLSVHPGEIAGFLPTIIAVSLLALAARAAAVYGLTPLAARLFHMPHIDTQDRHIMWWGGLKGGLAVAIVLSIPDSVEAKPILVNLAVGVVLFTLLVNAPSIRPLMSRLGLDRLTPREREGLDEALDQARTEAGRLLDDWHSTGLLSAKGRTMALGRIADQLAHPDDAGNEALSCIGPAARALAAESTELERLRADHAISQYVYFDLRAELRRRIDRLGTEDDSAPADNPFSRFEYAVIRRLRERNWAAPLLAAYQRTRLVQQLQRRLGRLLMSRAALSSLMQDPACHGEITELMVETARQSVDAETASLAELRADFPAFYRRLESSLIPRAALTRAERAAAHRHEHGEVGTKVYNRVLDILHEARHGLPALKGSDHDDVLEMLQSVAFLAGLPEDALSALARHATEMSFLPGDMVIGEGEHGDALYLVRRGVLDVTREQQRIGALDEGEAFGEMALLGDAVRQATVTAAQSCVLLRLRRADVLKVADAYPELKQRLEAEQEKHRS